MKTKKFMLNCDKVEIHVAESRTALFILGLTIMCKNGKEVTILTSGSVEGTTPVKTSGVETILESLSTLDVKIDADELV